MLEQGQGLYFTPKRARKFKVETIFNLSPGPQQSTYRDAVPNPTYRNLITMGPTSGWEPGGHCRHHTMEEILPSLTQCWGENRQHNPSASQGKQAGLLLYFISNTLQYSYTARGWQTSKATPFFREAAWAYSAQRVNVNTSS